jgi:hypothetical protein
MKISFESELMKNQKHAVVMAPDRAFEVLQSADGDSVFFSVGTDGVFYITREVTGTATGWDKVDLSSSLAADHGGAAVTAKMFSVAQNAATLGVDLALVVTTGGQDYLYLALGHANTDQAWSAGVAWTLVPFDAGTAPNPLTIADVLVMNIPAAGGGAVENIFVDIIRKPGDPLKLLDRYYISPGGPKKWNLQKLAADLAAGSISSCLGQRTGDPVPGIYTFGTIGSTQELIFTPQYNYFRPTVAPSPARLTLPAGASAIASAIDASGVSNLFVAGTAGLYLFAPDNQHDQASPVLVVPSILAAGASALAAATDGKRTAVWGVDPQGYLFYAQCPAGSEASLGAWSHPVPLLPSVEAFAFFLNLNAGNNILFAHVDGQSLIQLTQDPVTTDWRQRSILLPATDPDDVIEYNTFTTHIQVTDDHQVGAPNTTVALTATSPVSVYVENVYYLLSPTVPVQTTTDVTGVLTVIQETQSLSAVCFRAVLADTPSVAAEINPMSNALATLGTIQSGGDLGNVQVTNADGTTQPLVPASVSAGDKDAAAQSIKQFATISAGLPQDGSVQSAAAQHAMAARAATAAAIPQFWGITFGAGGLTYHEGTAAIAPNFSPRTVTVSAALAAGDRAAVEDLATSIDVAIGDFFLWMQQAFNEVESFVVQVANGVYNFLATIAGEVYLLILDCIDAVVHAVEFVFNKIEVFFEDLIKWLGFIFGWADILRTHQVIKNIFNQYIANCVASLGDTRTSLQQAFTEAQNFINSWAGIQGNIPADLAGGSMNQSTSSADQAPGQGSPQSNWGLYHCKSNATSAGVSTPSRTLGDDAASAFGALTSAFEREGEVLQAAYDSFKTNIIDKIQELSFLQIMEAAIAIFADALLQSLENVALAALDLFIAAADGALDALNATIDIPVISWLYKQIADADLSLLDLVCLVVAIPVTICYKLIAEETPFPDDATTTALINATSWAAIQQIINPPAPRAALAARDAVAQPEIIDYGLNNRLILASGIMALIGALGTSIMASIKAQPGVSGKVSQVLTGINSVFYLAYASPDLMAGVQQMQQNLWWAIMNTVVAGYMIYKTAVMDLVYTFEPEGKEDAEIWNSQVSPGMDAVGNAIWQIPVFGAIADSVNWNATGGLGFAGNTCFDANGIMSPFIANASKAAQADPETLPALWLLLAIAALLNLIYGGTTLAASIIQYQTPPPAPTTPTTPPTPPTSP